jgi:tellurite resistance protein TehA-like permease
LIDGPPGIAQVDADQVKPARFGWLADFFPGYFSLSMATGIVAIASHALHHDNIGLVLFWVNIVVYGALWCITVARIIRFPRLLLANFCTHAVGPTFLTMVAATSLIGSQCASFGIALVLLPWLLGFALILWIGLIYGFLAVMTLGPAKPDLEHGLNGSWFLIVVGTQSLAILGSIVSRVVQAPIVDFFALAACLLGGVLYLMLLGLVFYRWAFIPMSSAEMTEPWWINMGAAAITTLAGADLLGSPEFSSLRSFLDPFTVMFWATATFWLPLLAVLFLRKYVIEWRNLKYRPGVWSLVFPLGMYTTAMQTYASASGTDFLHLVAQDFYWVALASWILSMVGLGHDIKRSMSWFQNEQH